VLLGFTQLPCSMARLVAKPKNTFYSTLGISSD
jgi:hypothetical protein